MPEAPAHPNGDTHLALPTLALYATAEARGWWRGYAGFEQRLAAAVARTSQPLLTQARLAWWRDRLREPPDRWPQGEPLLADLTIWRGELAALGGLVDAWEACAVAGDGGAALREARIAAMAALARLAGCGAAAAVRRAAHEWVFAETTAGDAPPRLPRAMRPLLILRGLALRQARRQQPAPLGDFLATVRIGLFGR